jgi:hypothetical protein
MARSSNAAKLDLFRGVSVVEARREIIKSEELHFELRDL